MSNEQKFGGFRVCDKCGRPCKNGLTCECMNNRKRVAYIAGPMRHNQWYNAPGFYHAEIELRRQGFDVINPHEQDLEAGFNVYTLSKDHDWSTYPPGFDKEACYKRCIDAVTNCDLIYMLKGWQESTGAKAELALARWMGKQVVYEDNNGKRVYINHDEYEKYLEGMNHGVEGGKPSNTENPKDAIGSGKLPIHLWPTTATMMGSIGFLNGMLKYGRANFRAVGVRAGIYYDACRRHIDAWFEGEDIDPDDSVPHLAAALCCLAIIVDAQAAGKLNDDRNFPGGYRKLRDELSPLVAQLKEKHADKNPRHYTIGDE